MRARLQRDVGRSTMRAFAGFAQCEYFRMRFAGTLVPALPQHFFAPGDDAAYAWIRLRGVETALGQPQGLCHVHMVDGMEGVWTSIHGHAVCAITRRLSR